MNIRQFVDKMNAPYRKAKPDTNLQIIRKLRSLGQKKLADRSGIPIRTIQQYEQRQKDINKARSDTLHGLAATLDCRMEELLEKVE